MKDLMIDIETLGTKPGSVVFEIGAVSFDLSTGQTGKELHRIIDGHDSRNHGLTTDKETVEFWNQQGGFRQQGAIPLREAMNDLGVFIIQQDPDRVWAWGMDFDGPLLSACFNVFNLDLPWSYWQGRDARTVWDLAFPGVKHERSPGHSAIRDCHQQIQQLTAAVYALKNQTDQTWEERRK